MLHYATLHQVRSYLGMAVTETADDGKLRDFIVRSVKSIDKRCRRRFDVRRATLSFDYPLKRRERMGVYSVEDFVYQMNMVADWSNSRLKLDDDLLEVLTLTNGDDVEIDSDDYVLDPRRTYPKLSISLKSSSGVTWQHGDNGAVREVIDLDGYWGHNPDYDEAFVDSLDTVEDNPLSNSATELTVNDADGDAGDYTAVRFQAGHMIKIEDEFCFVRGVNATTNKLTVARGFHGTDGAEHAQDTIIYVYRPWGDIVMACDRLVAWRYRQKDADVFDKINIIGTGIQISPSAMPPDVLELLPAPKPMRL